MANPTSPFTASASAQRLPALKVGAGKLVISLSDASATDRVVLRIHPIEDVSATRADVYLKAGELLEINGCSLVTGLASDVTVLAASGTPPVYFGVM